MVTNLLTWEGARDACSNEFVFGTEKPTSTDEASSFISIGGSSKLKCQLHLGRLPNNGWRRENFKHWSATRSSMRSLGAFPTTPTLRHIILTHCPKPNEIFVLVQEGDVSARRANIIAAGSLGKVMHSLYFVCFVLFVCLFVCKTLGSCFKLKHLLIIRWKSQEVEISHRNDLKRWSRMKWKRRSTTRQKVWS